MRELRRPNPPTRNATRREILEAIKPMPQTPAVPGRAKEVPVIGMPGLQRFDVIGPKG